MLRNCGLELPKHTFYVDNIFVYQPLPHVKSMYYLDVNFYRYFIGRDDQSVNEKVMISRIDQQILVTKLMLGYYDVTKIKNPKLRRYLEIMMTVTSILAIRSETEENLKKKKELWQYLKQQNFTLYMRLRWGFLGQGVNLRQIEYRTQAADHPILWAGDETSYYLKFYIFQVVDEK